MKSVAAIVSMAMFDALRYLEVGMQRRGVFINFIVYFGVFLQVHRCRGTGTEPRLHGETRKQILLLRTTKDKE